MVRALAATTRFVFFTDPFGNKYELVSLSRRKHLMDVVAVSLQTENRGAR